LIVVVINGKQNSIEQPMTVSAYLESAGLAGRQLAVAVNGVVLRREEFSTVQLKDGDRVEIVRPVGGGAVGPARAFQAN
jgi:thiamine biosynthesis protein ThiS